ncbi:MAG TPA: hypothetical protein VMX13_07740 [Sedimentisphaerales bacterium]|nr:hypothetical protein [Sedimentisphaerales bacterium]
MNNHKMSYLFVAFCAAAAFIVGCIPEDSLQWSQNGSVGLLRTQSALYLVDGKTGELTEIAEANVAPWPDISKDGNMVAYCRKVECQNLSEGLKVLPEGQVKIIEHWAGQMEKEILNNGGLVDGKFPLPEEGLLVPNDYGNWVIRYLCEKAGQELRERISKDDIEKAKQERLHYTRIIVAPTKAPGEGRVVAASVFNMVATRISPDGKFVAYLMHTQQGEVSNAFEEYGLYVASLDGGVNTMLVATRVAIGYDWRADSKAIAYITADKKDLLHESMILGTLKESIVADEDGNLRAQPVPSGEQGFSGTHRCTGGEKDLAGILFYPWMKVQYGQSGRVFFSSATLSLPSGSMDDPKWSLFCYDSVTRSVANVLPTIASDLVGQNVNVFALSPDGKSVLLCMEKNRFGIYTFVDGTAEVAIEEEEMFGDRLDLAPAWKGNSEISCLVAENSHFLVKKGQEKHNRKEIVVLGADGDIRQVLSRNWPDELLSQSSKDQGAVPVEQIIGSTQD